MDDSSSTPSVRGGPPAPPPAVTRAAGAAYLPIYGTDGTLATRAGDPRWPISAPATRVGSGELGASSELRSQGARDELAWAAELRPASASMAAARPHIGASSASAPRGSSGGARPPMAPPAKKRALFVAPHRQEALRSRAPRPGGELPPLQLLNSDGSGGSSLVGSLSAPRQLLNSYVHGDCNPTESAFFDWTPTTDDAAEDPRPSQPFMNLLTQDKDADLQVLMHEDATPTKHQPKRGSNYSLEEDIQLCKSWINISNDPIVGTDQPGKTYWERITQDFHRNKDFESDRTANSIEHRCQLILKECMKFQGYFEDIERCHPSGVPYQEHLLQAQSLYASKNKGKRYPFVDCWLVVRHTEKFAALPGLNKSKNKKSSTNLNLNIPAGSEGDEGVQDTAQAEESSSKKPRPPGRKKSKEKLKRGEGDDDELKDMMKSLLELKAQQMQRKEELDQRKIELEERRLQWKQEERIMFCDVSTMDEPSKAYVMTRRVEIARMAALRASRGESGSVSESGGSV